MIEAFLREELKGFKPYKTSKEKYEIKLDANESFINLTEELSEELVEAVIGCEFNRYPDGMADEVCELYGKYVGVEREKIIAGNGSDELIQIITSAFISRRDRVVVLNPDFSMYTQYSRVVGGDVIQYELDKDFKLDEDGLLKKIDETGAKLLFLSVPNNPVGGIIEEDKIEKIIRKANCIVVLDEAYGEFYGKTFVNRVDEFENLIVLRTCSKALGAAALRLGFLISNDIMVGELLKVKPPFNVNSVTQAIGKVILQNTDSIKRSIEKIIVERDLLVKELKELNFKVYETKANFIFVRVANIETVDSKLKDKGIIVRTFKSTKLKDFMRITVGSREENRMLVEVLKAKQDI